VAEWRGILSTSDQAFDPAWVEHQQVNGFHAEQTLNAGFRGDTFFGHEQRQHKGQRNQLEFGDEIFVAKPSLVAHAVITTAMTTALTRATDRVSNESSQGVATCETIEMRGFAGMSVHLSGGLDGKPIADPQPGIRVIHPTGRA